jgi:hypothetical protein
MFALLVSPDYNLPHVVSINSVDHRDFLCAGYKEIDTGTKREMWELAEEMLQEIYSPA